MSKKKKNRIRVISNVTMSPGTVTATLPAVTAFTAEAAMLKTWKNEGNVWGLHPTGIYRRAMGGVSGWVKAEKELAVLHPELSTQTPGLVKIDNAFRPTPGQLRYVFDQVFSKDGQCLYHETMVVFGKDKETGVIRAFVPTQNVSRTNVVAVKDGGVTAFAEKHHIVGDAHTHPWQGLPSASGTDAGSMKDQAGIYAIVSAGAEVQWYASSSGTVTKADVWRLAEMRAEAVDIFTVDGEPIEKMFRQQTFGVNFDGNVDTRTQHHHTYMNTINNPWPDNETDTYAVNETQHYGEQRISGGQTNSRVYEEPKWTSAAVEKDIDFKGWAWKDIVLIRIGKNTYTVPTYIWERRKECWMPFVDEWRRGSITPLNWNKQHTEKTK